MAPKAKYTPERIATIAKHSGEAAREAAPNVELLTCDFVYEEDESACNADGNFRRDASLRFRWRVKCACYDEVCDVTARCNRIAERGVPMPEHWNVALRCLNLDRCAEEKVNRARVPGNMRLGCVVLGRARPLLLQTYAGSRYPSRTTV